MQYFSVEIASSFQIIKEIYTCNGNVLSSFLSWILHVIVRLFFFISWKKIQPYLKLAPSVSYHPFKWLGINCFVRKYI